MIFASFYATAHCKRQRCCFAEPVSESILTICDLDVLLVALFQLIKKRMQNVHVITSLAACDAAFLSRKASVLYRSFLICNVPFDTCGCRILSICTASFLYSLPLDFCRRRPWEVSHNQSHTRRSRNGTAAE